MDLRKCRTVWFQSPQKAPKHQRRIPLSDRLCSKVSKLFARKRMPGFCVRKPSEQFKKLCYTLCPHLLCLEPSSALLGNLMSLYSCSNLQNWPYNNLCGSAFFQIKMRASDVCLVCPCSRSFQLAADMHMAFCPPSRLISKSQRRRSLLCFKIQDFIFMLSEWIHVYGSSLSSNLLF